MKRTLLALASIAAVVGLSVAATLRPQVFSFLQLIPYGDKLGHFGIFGVVTFVVIRAIDGPRAVWFGSAAVALIVLIEEFLQLFSANRTFSLLDLSASLLGVAVFTWLSYTYSKRESLK